jgi:hypothetical protein
MLEFRKPTLQSRALQIRVREKWLPSRFSSREVQTRRGKSRALL